MSVALNIVYAIVYRAVLIINHSKALQFVLEDAYAMLCTLITIKFYLINFPV